MENEQTYPELEKAKAEQEKLKLHHLSIDLTLEGAPGEIELPKGEPGRDGQPGRDGFTPVITVTDQEDGSHVVSITQPDGREPITTTIKDGKAGARGEKGERGDASETLVVADMYRFDKVSKVETFYYFTLQDLSKFLYTNIQYYPQKLDWAHWWSDIKSTSDITVDVPMKSLGGSTVLNSSNVTVIDKDARLYEVFGAYDNGGYAPNPGGYRTRFYKHVGQGDALMREPADSEYEAVWNFLNAYGNAEQAKSFGGYLYTIVRLTSRKGKTSVFVTKQYRPNNKNF